MEPTKVYPIVAVLSLVTVEYGGWALLTFISARSGQLDDFQTQFFRAGPAHARMRLGLIDGAADVHRAADRAVLGASTGGQRDP